ncbi:hypothetical protein KY358_02260 [Candidatus Woesearchaeota archaeon]|nr:hypothetical protein [Candidatus Woesearchaeota archaeon]
MGGSGGHCAPQYFHLIETPIFPHRKREEIAKLYHNPIDYPKVVSMEDFSFIDEKWSKTAGIYEIDKSIKQIKQKLYQVIHYIIVGKKIDYDFLFLIGKSSKR